MYPLLPVSMVIHTAGPEQLKASQIGLLHLKVKDDQENLHEIMLENARVVPRLQNQASYKQLIENRHRLFCHETQAGIVLNKNPKFSPDDVVISFAMGENGLYYLEENLPEEKACHCVWCQWLSKEYKN
jgi:hypothetical protein